MPTAKSWQAASNFDDDTLDGVANLGEEIVVHLASR
jgi:hypothetical protein